MKVIITGASGMIGMAVLLECLDHSSITEVLSIGRKILVLEHPKLKQQMHADFADFSSVRDQLSGYDAAYLCMGVSAAGMDEEEYTVKTYNYTLSLARPLAELNPNMTCIYVSGQGTDSSENGRTMWARVKGKTENDLLNLGFRQAFMFRPGGIIPMRGVVPSSKLYRVLIANLGWLLRLLKWFFPKSIITSRQIGLAMINITLDGYEKSIINPRDMIQLAAISK
jgi:uncharacterized protein YbjT (DUF2867 family)